VQVQDARRKTDVVVRHREGSRHRSEATAPSLPEFTDVADRRLRTLSCLLDQVAKQLRSLRSECTAQSFHSGEGVASGSAALTKDKLTPQEIRIVQLAMRGYDNRVIAEHLNLSVNTIKSHLRHALRKLGLRSRHQLGWIPFSPEDSPAPGCANDGSNGAPGAIVGLPWDQ